MKIPRLKVFGPRRRTVLMFGPATTTLPSGVRLLVRNDEFRRAFIQASDFVEERRGWSLWRELGNDAPPEGVTTSERNFVQETVLQLCLYRAFIATGAKYDAVAGISLGDAAGAHAAGALDFEQTLHVMCETVRAVLCATGGDLVAVQASPARVREIIGDANVAMIFDWPVLSVWAVPDNLATRMQRQLRVAGVAYMRLGFGCLSHTDRVDTVGLRQAFEILPENEPVGKYYSTHEGGRVEGRIPKGRWVRAISEPVRLDDMWKELRKGGFTDVVYIGSVPADSDLFGALPDEERPTSFRRAETFLEYSEGGESPDISVHADNAPASIGTVFRSAAFARDPYPYIRQWHADSPVHRLDEKIVMILGYDAAESVLKQPEKFSSDPFGELSPVLPGADPPQHTTIRRIMAPYFTRDAVASKRHLIEETTRSTLDELRRRGNFDAVSEFAAAIPFAVQCSWLGLDPRSAAAIGPMQPGEPTWEDIETGLLPSGVVPDMVRNGVLSQSELRGLLPFLIGAGVLTVRDSLAFSLYTLLRKPDVSAALLGDPCLASAFVEELFRYESSVQGVVRRATVDTAVAGVEIPAGTILWVWLGAANRDPAKFDRPDDFVLGRAGPRHLAFGMGPHFCLGSHLAKLECEIVIGALIPHLSRLRATAPPDFVFNDLRAAPVFPWIRTMKSWQLAFLS